MATKHQHQHGGTDVYDDCCQGSARWDRMATDLILSARAAGIIPARVGSAVQWGMIAKGMLAMGYALPEERG